MPVTTIAVLGFWNVNAPTYSTTIRVQSNSEQIPWSIRPVSDRSMSNIAHYRAASNSCAHRVKRLCVTALLKERRVVGDDCNGCHRFANREDATDVSSRVTGTKVFFQDWQRDK